MLTGAGDYLKNRIGNRQPRLAIVLGSGLGAFADELTDRIEVPYIDIPCMAKMALEMLDSVRGLVQGAYVIPAVGRYDLAAQVVVRAREMVVR